MKRILPGVIFIVTFLVLASTRSALAVSSFTKFSGSPIITTGPQNWDSVHTSAPTVIYEDNIFKMWYAGHNGSMWSIGYATSSGGTNWTKYENNPVLQWDPSNQSEPKHFNTPTVIHDGGTYKMWYTSTPTDTSNFLIGYATSTDGIHWTKITSSALSPSMSWDAGGVVTPTVIKNGGEYKMWYAGWNGDWSLGYATSPDGIAWTEYVGNPVITPTEPWEKSQLVGPTVLYDGSTYQMWYNTNNAGPPSAIVYATSPDGMNWAKPADQNPVLTTGAVGQFDNQMVGYISAMKLGSTTVLWYGGQAVVGGSIKAQIGVASDGPFPVATPSATPTSTPTLTATPTPSPTPTPTPILPTTKVVVVPGMGASWNADAILNCKLTGYDGGWTLAPYAASIYQPLISSLNRAGYNVLPYYYDWRKQIPDNAPQLSSFISNATAPNERINLVGHSMGGLLGRAYLTSAGDSQRLDKFLSVGSPHQGAALAYPLWSAGVLRPGNLFLQIATTIVLRRCATRGTSDRVTLQRVVPSIQNILPTADYLRDLKTGLLKPIDSMTARNNWLPTNNFSPPFFGATVGSLVGNNHQTIQGMNVQSPRPIDILAGNWLDGKPAGHNAMQDGDGTVVVASAQIPGATNTTIDADHQMLVAGRAGRTEILSFLGTPGALSKTIMQDQVETEPTSALVVIAHPATFSVDDPRGNTVKSTDSMVTITNPISGTYKLRFTPNRLRTLAIVGQFFADGRIFWKEYTLTSLFPIQKKIFFNAQYPQEDALR